MANANAPFGLRPYRHMLGGVIRMNSFGDYKIASAYNTGIFSGDPVVKSSTTNEITVGAASSTQFCGVFAGCEYTDSAGNYVFSKHWPASQATKTGTERKAHVYDDPYISYVIMHDGTAAITDYGSTFDILYTTGNTTTGVSKVQLDTSNEGSSYVNLLVLGPVNSPDNVVGANQLVEVLLNEHVLRAALGSAGV